VSWFTHKPLGSKAIEKMELMCLHKPLGSKGIEKISIAREMDFMGICLLLLKEHLSYYVLNV
jgi:hypothetical protein